MLALLQIVSPIIIHMQWNEEPGASANNKYILFSQWDLLLSKKALDILTFMRKH